MREDQHHARPDLDLIRFEKLNVKNMTRSANSTVEQPGQRVAQKRGRCGCAVTHTSVACLVPVS